MCMQKNAALFMIDSLRSNHACWQWRTLRYEVSAFFELPSERCEVHATSSWEIAIALRPAPTENT